MNIEPTSIAGVFSISTNVFVDERGEFLRLYCDNELAPIVGSRKVVQANLSRTLHAGTVRGLHYQRQPYAEMKLVRCLSGAILDVAVDLRAGSPTFRKYHAEQLTPHNARMLSIPEGFAHGFQALEDDSAVLYLTTAPYTPDAESGVRFDEATIGIQWPLPPRNLSRRDAALPALDYAFSGI